MFEMIGNPDKQGDMEKYMRQQFQFWDYKHRNERPNLKH